MKEGAHQLVEGDPLNGGHTKNPNTPSNNKQILLLRRASPPPPLRMNLKKARGRGFAHDGGDDALSDERVTGTGFAQEEEEEVSLRKDEGTKTITGLAAREQRLFPHFAAIASTSSFHFGSSSWQQTTVEAGR